MATCPTASSGLVSVRAQGISLRKKKAYVSEVVKEGFTEKEGFKQHLGGSTEFQKTVRLESEPARPRQRRTNGQAWESTNYV